MVIAVFSSFLCPILFGTFLIGQLGVAMKDVNICSITFE